MNGWVFQCTGDGKTLLEIDTLDGASQDAYLLDVDGDGRKDHVSKPSFLNAHWFRVTMAGSSGNKERGGKALYIWNPATFYYQHYRTESMEPFRFATGEMVFPVVGQLSQGWRGLTLVALKVEKVDTGYVVTRRHLDSIVYDFTGFDATEQQVCRAIETIHDTIRDRHYIIVNWQAGWHPNGECVVVYDITDGKLKPVLTTGLFSFGIHSHDTEFDDGEPVVTYQLSDGYAYFARVSSIHHPFAKHVRGTSNLGAFIDDQNGDGYRDLFRTTGSSNAAWDEIVLVNFDLRTTSAPDDPTFRQLDVVERSGVLTVMLVEPGQITIDAVTSNGRQQHLLTVNGRPGANTVDIRQALQSWSPGAYYLRVSSRGRQATVPYVR